MAADEAQMPFIRNLASSDRKLRIASLDSLKLFLSTRKNLSRTDALKLWKGLYYAHYMTDRPIPQQRLAADLASLADALPRYSSTRAGSEEVVAVWFAAFWEVLGERWPHVDALRMDKFLLLVRRVFAAQLRYAADSSPAGEAVVKVLAEWPFEEAGDLRRVPLGLRLHALDMWVDELERGGFLEQEEEQEEKTPSELVKRLGEMVQALRYCPIKAARESARESYEDERLPWVQKVQGDEDDEMKEDEWGGFDD